MHSFFTPPPRSEKSPPIRRGRMRVSSVRSLGEGREDTLRRVPRSPSLKLWKRKRPNEAYGGATPACRNALRRAGTAFKPMRLHRFLPQYQKAPPFGSITLTILSLSKDKAGMNEGAIWGFRYGVSSSIPIGSPGL